MKRIFSTIVFASLALSTFAGGLLTNTNQHAAFVRNPMRYASLETDAIYFNPAGTAFFKEGWALSANWQMIWQDRDVTSALTNKSYKGEVYVPCMPTIMASYKTGDWTFSGFFGIPGGGGNAQFNDGLPAFDAMGAGLVAAQGMSATSAFESTQYVFSLQLGAAYKISDNWSVYAGIRGNYTSANYSGAITAVHPQAGAAGKILDLDLTQTGIAFAPVIGVDYKIGDFNFAAKYEFRAVTNVENETDKFESELLAPKLGNDANLDGKIGAISQAMPELGGALGKLATLQNGQTLRSDAPALLSLAGSWQATSWFKAMIGATYYFDKDAKVESLLGGADNNVNLDRNTYELLAGVEFNVTKNLLLSAGIQYSDFGITDAYTSDLGFINDSFMTGLGAKYSFNENWDLNVGFCYANYAHDTNKLNGSSYFRKTYNATIGVDFRF
ncbi:MAG: outer membrane beta-barrel protein [Bacteroidaceae bacterium]|nr:outer membrane beta-barrel protein [Bacteroidaceae bacterium]